MLLAQEEQTWSTSCEGFSSNFPPNYFLLRIAAATIRACLHKELESSRLASETWPFQNYFQNTFVWWYLFHVWAWLVPIIWEVGQKNHLGVQCHSGVTESIDKIWASNTWRDHWTHRWSFDDTKILISPKLDNLDSCTIFDIYKSNCNCLSPVKMYNFLGEFYMIYDPPPAPRYPILSTFIYVFVSYISI